MFAVNGPSGPSSRHERRVKSDRQRKEENETTRCLAEKTKKHFFREKHAQAATNKHENGKEFPKKSDIFKGCQIVFNGQTGKISLYYLAKLVKEHGGNVASSMATRITHMVGSNLNGSKADKVLRSSGKFKFVSPEWILQSIKHKTRQPEFEFLVYKDSQAARSLRAGFSRAASSNK
ncbi:unnamed protein product [Peronospora farinosa]|uniref:BRCT domain-containing protein n=1 Tax=Peronospora farinosa TaxID=134698 RepID=A0AAV0U3Q5_9STRA|nr:unnamed protein product [Peronospora farinosa]CAI5730263.1 unnamed protein product [Peronospora farinosa]